MHYISLCTYSWTSDSVHLHVQTSFHELEKWTSTQTNRFSKVIIKPGKEQRGLKVTFLQTWVAKQQSLDILNEWRTRRTENLAVMQWEKQYINELCNARNINDHNQKLKNTFPSSILVSVPCLKTCSLF